MSEIKIGKTPYWLFYESDDYKKIENCGKWMHFFDKDNYEFAKGVCIKAIREKVITACKHTSFESDSLTNPMSNNRNSGVICFYLDGKSDEKHKMILEFFMINNLIQKRTKVKRTHKAQIESLKFLKDALRV